MLEYDTYQLALDDAKFHFEAFFDNCWREYGNKHSFEMILQESQKLVDHFELIPNLTNFDFEQYAKQRYKLLEFKKIMDPIYHRFSY